jgi:hypothetical protein
MDFQEIIEQLQQFKPSSVFVYGSRARSDHKPDSDYEIGVIFRGTRYVSRSQIAKKVALTEVNIYPFKLEQLQSGQIDTPFQVQVYLRDLVLSAKTIGGEEIIEHLDPPSITALSLLQEVRFDLGRATAALLSKRHGDDKSATLGFSKSCLFAARCLVILKLHQFPTTYDGILKLASQVITDQKYQTLVQDAYDVRQRSAQVTDQLLFDNIAFLTRVVEPTLMEAYRKLSAKPII